MAKIPAERGAEKFPCCGRRLCLKPQEHKAMNQKPLPAQLLNPVRWDGMGCFPLVSPEERLHPGRLQCTLSLQ